MTSRSPRSTDSGSPTSTTGCATGERLSATSCTCPRPPARSAPPGRRAQGWDLDPVITDFEPVTCHLGHKLGLPVIAIDNQHLLTDTQISYPQEYRKEAAAAKLVTRLMTPRANAYLVISFFMPRVKKKKTFLFSPILRKEILGATPSIGQHVLVYLTAKAAELTDLLKTVRQSFVCYGFDRQGRDGNIEYCKRVATTS